MRTRQSAEAWELVLWRVHQGEFLGEDGEARAELEGLGLVRGEWILGATLCSTTKARRKALSKDEMSNISTSRLRTIHKQEINLTISTSSRLAIWSRIRNLQNRSTVNVALDRLTRELAELQPLSKKVLAITRRVEVIM